MARGGGRSGQGAPAAPVAAPENPEEPAETAPEAKREPIGRAAPEIPPNPNPGNGWVYCEAIGTCLVRGMPEFAGARFWLDPDQAARLSTKGSLRIIGK